MAYGDEDLQRWKYNQQRNRADILEAENVELRELLKRAMYLLAHAPVEDSPLWIASYNKLLEDTRK